MPDKKPSQQDDVWTVMFNGLVEAVKMVFSIFVFFLHSGKSNSSLDSVKKENGIGEMRNGHSGYGYYVNGMRTDCDDE